MQLHKSRWCALALIPGAVFMLFIASPRNAASEQETSMQQQGTSAEAQSARFGEPQFAYVIVRVGPLKDPEGLQAYLKLLRPVLAKFGGELLLQGRPVEVLLEGMNAQRMIAVVRFKNAEQARRWFHSDEYREPKKLFLQSAIVSMTLFEGIFGF
jgi:uncharacterized protein (DUF1330 family)